MIALDPEQLYAALDRERRHRRISWRTVATQAGVAASFFTRLGRGKRPDVDTYGRLLDWLGMNWPPFFKVVALALLLCGCGMTLVGGGPQRGVNHCITNAGCGCGYYCNWRDLCVPVKQEATWCQ